MTHIEIYLGSALEASNAGLLSEEEVKYLKQILDLPRAKRKTLPGYLYWRLYNMHQKWVNHIG